MTLKRIANTVKHVTWFIGLLAKIGGVGAAISVFVLCLLIMASVVARYVFNRPFLYVDELASYLLATIVFLGLAYTLREGGHIRVEMIIDRLRRKTRTALTGITAILGVVWAYCLLMGVTGLWLRYFKGDVLGYGTLQAPLWVPALSLVIGGALLLLQVLAEICKIFLLNRK